MKSLLLSAYNHLEIADMPVPAPGPGEVLIRVEACGICGSDVHGFDGSSGRRIPPLVMGHEAAGTIAALGEGVRSYKVGERVTFDSLISCGECVYCKRGDLNLCDNRQVVGVSCGDYRRHGAFAEFCVVPERVLYRLADAMTFPEAAMLEPTAVTLHAVRVTELTGGETALVVGAGMIGLLTMQVARVAGCDRVFVADIDETRLELARQLGADAVFNSKDVDVPAKMLELTGGQGVDVAFEAVGRNETVGIAIDSTRKGGTVTLIGNITPEVTLPLQKVVTREIRLQGSCAISGEYPEAIELISAGKIQVKPLITAVDPLEEGPRWFERLYAHEPNLMKVILTPGA
jgi:L-iditol 2-dehydrogenase